MGQSVKRKGKDTGCIQMEKGFLLIIRDDQLLLFPHVDRMTVQHGGIMLDKVMAFEQVDPDDEDKLDAEDGQHYVFYTVSRE